MGDDDGTSPFGSNVENDGAAAEGEWDTPEWRAAMIEKYAKRDGG
jgi:hypothetical protein